MKIGAAGNELRNLVRAFELQHEHAEKIRKRHERLAKLGRPVKARSHREATG